ncbi:MAG: hypothetical protein ACE14S_08245 [Candidatus Bathyarchaeia archaeon]
MTIKACVLALEDTLNEIKNACPEVQSIFIFRRDKTILAKDDATDEAVADQTIKTFNALNNRAIFNGGVESLTIQGTESRAIITRVDNLYLATIASRGADEKAFKALTRVMLPAILRLIETIQPKLTATESALSAGSGFSEQRLKTVLTTHEEPAAAEAEEEVKVEEPTEQAEPAVSSPSQLTNAPASQLIVENMGGFGIGKLLSSEETVRVDSSVIAQWKDLYGYTQIDEVQVEDTRTGRKTTCKIKPIKDSKLEGKGIIQLPEKVQNALQTKKGALVTVKPLTEKRGN